MTTPTPGPSTSEITTNAIPLSPAGMGEEGSSDAGIQIAKECECYHYVNHDCVHVHEHVAYAGGGGGDRCNGFERPPPPLPKMRSPVFTIC